MITNPAVIFKPFMHDGMHALDVGCGGGFATIELARLSGPEGGVTAVDLQPEMLDVVKQRAEAAGLTDRIRTHCGDAGSLNIAETFDFANAFWMVHEVPDTEGFLRGIHSHLKPNGVLLVVEPKFHVSRKTFDAMTETARGIGFTIQATPHVRISHAVALSKR